MRDQEQADAERAQIGQLKNQLADLSAKLLDSQRQEQGQPGPEGGNPFLTNK